MLDALFHYQFMKNALIACILSSIICGIIGVIITEKKLIMMSGGIAHTAYGGVGLGYLLNFTPLLGALIFAVLAALGIGKINKKDESQSDVVIGMFWSLGMALGIIFIGLNPGYPPDMSSYLFGNILSVTNSSIFMMLILTTLVVFIVVSMFQTWKTYLFDSEFAYVIGLKTKFLDSLLLILIAITVVALIRVAGIILILAMLTAPAASATLFTKSLKSRIFLAIAFGAIYCILGLVISYELDIASGACIVIVSVTTYLILYKLNKHNVRYHKTKKQPAKN